MTIAPQAVPAVPSAHKAAPGGLRLDLLRAFVVLAEELHFTRSADRLFLSQSGLSRRIHQLEASLGVSLVVRTTREVRLTSCGEAFAAHAVLVLAAADAAMAALHDPPRHRLRSVAALPRPT